MVEVPLTALFLPYIGTTMRIFPHLTKMQRVITNIENEFNRKPIVFGIHPNEFIDESREKRIIHKQSRNLINYLFKDSFSIAIKNEKSREKCYTVIQKRN